MKPASRLLFLLFVICVVSSCFQHNVADKRLPEKIDIKKAFENIKPVNIADISKDHEYIVLESKNESLTGSNVAFYSDDQYLIAIDRRQILLFDRKSGKFIRKIGNSGSGPGEYSRPYSKMPYDEEKKVIYADRNRERYEYDLNGKLAGTKKGPELVYDFVNIDEDTYAAFIDNYLGDEKNKIVIFNQEDSVIKIFPNYLSFPFNGSINVFVPNAWFYRLNDQLYFCEKFNDTIFNVTADKLTPRFVFNKGIHSFPYELRGGSDYTGDKYFFPENILESPGYLFYTFRYNMKIYTAVYDKKRKETVVNDFVGESGKGYINNTDGFVPLELSSINAKGELVCSIDAYKIKLWFDANKERVDQLPAYLQKLKNISESENPVVVIARPD